MNNFYVVVYHKFLTSQLMFKKYNSRQSMKRSIKALRKKRWLSDRVLRNPEKGEVRAAVRQVRNKYL